MNHVQPSPDTPADLPVQAPRRRTKPHRCEHGEQTETVNYGLQRLVCQACGRLWVEAISPSEPGQLFQHRTKTASV